MLSKQSQNSKLRFEEISRRPNIKATHWASPTGPASYYHNQGDRFSDSPRKEASFQGIENLVYLLTATEPQVPSTTHNPPGVPP